MNIDTSKYQVNVIIANAESLVKEHALEEAFIPESLGFIIKPSSVMTFSQETTESKVKPAKIDNAEV